MDDINYIWMINCILGVRCSNQQHDIRKICWVLVLAFGSQKSLFGRGLDVQDHWKPESDTIRHLFRNSHRLHQREIWDPIPHSPSSDNEATQGPSLGQNLEFCQEPRCIWTTNTVVLDARQTGKKTETPSGAHVALKTADARECIFMPLKIEANQ